MKRPQSASLKPQPSNQAPKPKPEWNSNMNENPYKLTRAEIL